MSDAVEVSVRLARLEAAHGRLRLLAAGLGVAVVLLGVVLPMTRRTVSAGNYLLTADGQTRASLTMTPAGGPALALYDGEGRIRISLSMRQDGSPDITLTDDAGRIRAALAVGREGVPNLYLTDDFGGVRAALGVPSDGLPALVLLGESGQVRYMTP